jgi:hypothetical protein
MRWNKREVKRGRTLGKREIEADKMKKEEEEKQQQ